MRLIQKYPGLVNRHYTMNPKTEVLVPNMADLENGMVVLIAGVGFKYEVQGKMVHDFGVMSTPILLAVNRWCTVKDVASFNNTVTFIGVYEDGSEMRRTYEKNTAWLVKTGPSAFMTVEDKREKILDLVKDTLVRVGGVSLVSESVHLTAYAEQTTDKIMKLI